MTMTDPTAAERMADLYFAGLRMMGFVFEPEAEQRAERMLADHVQTALVEAKQEAWEEAAIAVEGYANLTDQSTRIAHELRRRSRAHDAE